MRKGLLYLFAAAALVLIVSVAWWTRAYVERHYDASVHTVQPGETAESIATAAGVPLEALAGANAMAPDEMALAPGDKIVVPAPATNTVDQWITHLIGLAGTALGVFMSLWLAMVAGLLPPPIRRQVLGISLVLGVASYTATYAVIQEPVRLTPTFLFIAIRDGFAWAAAFPMLARALGIRDTAPRQPEPAKAPAKAPATSPAKAPPEPTVEALPPPPEDEAAG